MWRAACIRSLLDTAPARPHTHIYPPLPLFVDKAELSGDGSDPGSPATGVVDLLEAFQLDRMESQRGANVPSPGRRGSRPALDEETQEKADEDRAPPARRPTFSAEEDLSLADMLARFQNKAESPQPEAGTTTPPRRAERRCATPGRRGAAPASDSEEMSAASTSPSPPESPAYAKHLTPQPSLPPPAFPGPPVQYGAVTPPRYDRSPSPSPPPSPNSPSVADRGADNSYVSLASSASSSPSLGRVTLPGMQTPPRPGCNRGALAQPSSNSVSSNGGADVGALLHRLRLRQDLSSATAEADANDTVASAGLRGEPAVGENLDYAIAAMELVSQTLDASRGRFSAEEPDAEGSPTFGESSAAFSGDAVIEAMRLVNQYHTDAKQASENLDCIEAMARPGGHGGAPSYDVGYGEPTMPQRPPGGKGRSAAVARPTFVQTDL